MSTEQPTVDDAQVQGQRAPVVADVPSREAVDAAATRDYGRFDDDDDDWLEEPEQLARRPRRRLLSPIPLALLGVLLVACGFIGGVLVEKNETSSGTSTGSAASAAARFRALRGGTGASGASGSSSSTGAAGFVRPTAGTVAYLDGSTLYVTNSEGNTVKVTTSPSTSVTKSVKATVTGIHPGETVTVTGSTESDGTLSAESISVGSSAGGGLAALFGGTGSSSVGGGSGAGAGGGSGSSSSSSSGSSSSGSGSSGSSSRSSGGGSSGSSSGEPALFGKGG